MERERKRKEEEERRSKELEVEKQKKAEMEVRRKGEEDLLRKMEADRHAAEQLQQQLNAENQRLREQLEQVTFRFFQKRSTRN
jgi:hypothetical protein